MKRIVLVLLAVALAVPFAHATCGGGGGGGMGGMMPSGGGAQRDAYLVPWKLLNSPNSVPLTTPLTLYWFAGSQREMQSGDLMSSRILTIAATQCVGMQLVSPEDAATIAKWELAGKLPAALL